MSQDQNNEGKNVDYQPHQLGRLVSDHEQQDRAQLAQLGSGPIFTQLQDRPASWPNGAANVSWRTWPNI